MNQPYQPKHGTAKTEVNISCICRKYDTTKPYCSGCVQKLRIVPEN